MMETSGGSSDHRRCQSSAAAGGPSRSLPVRFAPSSFIQARLSAALDHLGISPASTNRAESESLVGGGARGHASGRINPPAASTSSGGEVSIRIIAAADQESLSAGLGQPDPVIVGPGSSGAAVVSSESNATSSDRQGGDGGSDSVVREAASSSPFAPESVSSVGSRRTDGESNASGGNSRDSSYQRYDIQQVARWIEQLLPFSLLLLVVFIRQHLQGFFVTIWIAAVMFKSNDILRKQTALKSERKIAVLIGITLVFLIHIFGVYWWYRNSNLLYPLVMLPPKEVLPFWHAIFIIMVNDTMVRLAAMVVKCMLLMHYKNSRGHNFRRQGKMLTLVEYFLLWYRALLPTPVWYRFFLNKEYGSLFPSLTTGLYLTFKLTTVVEKVQSFFAALKALSQKEVHYGSYATTEEVIAAGDHCAICQEKIQAPILLCCKHIFCEDCVSEWFERERTCPLCRALVKPADIRSFGDGSTSLFFQLF